MLAVSKGLLFNRRIFQLHDILQANSFDSFSVILIQ